MSILAELNTLLEGLGVKVETGVFKGKAPDEYMVVTPLSDTFELFADNLPQAEVQEARLSLFSKMNWTTIIKCNTLPRESGDILITK